MASLLELMGLDPDVVDWWQLAKCRNAPPEIFFDDYEENESIAMAVKDLCDGCPVKAACLANGITNKEYGVWGGVYLEKGVPKKMHEGKQ